MGSVRGRAIALAMATTLVLGLVPMVSAATLATFGTPTAASSFKTGVLFSQPLTIDKAVDRVELLLTVADAIGPTIISVTPPDGTGVMTLTHRLDPAADGHLTPNTPLVARWRLTAKGDHADVVIGPEVAITYVDDRYTWQTASGDLVRVHWYEGSKAFGQRALRIGEDAVRKTSTLLGVVESKPIDFYVYADQGPFYDALGPGTRENVGGQANAGIRTLFALIPPAQIDDPWVGIVVPHELTHLVFNTAVDNPYHFPPLWLNEGLAVYQSQGYDLSDRGDVEAAARNGTLMPLAALGGQFPTRVERFRLAYAESVSAVDHLVRTYGPDALVALIRSYAQGRTDDEAFTTALGLDMTAFGSAWLADLKAVPPKRYGPQPAVPGPVPAQWAGQPGASPITPGGGVASGVPSVPTAAGSTSPNVGGTDGTGSGTGNGFPWSVLIVVALGAALATALLVARRRRRRTVETP